MLDCKPANTSIIQNHKLTEYPSQIPTDKGRYWRLVGKLIYLSHTRHDIAYTVSVGSQFMHQPSKDHIKTMIWILQYLKSSLEKRFMFVKNNHLQVNQTPIGQGIPYIKDPPQATSCLSGGILLRGKVRSKR
jgi:hypothetical protein